jgi:hypothetical protein
MLKKSLLAFISLLALLALSAQATVLQLAPINPLTTTTYNNFMVQSMDLNAQCLAAGDPRCIPSGPYPVQSSPGNIADQVIILTGANGNQLNNIPQPLPVGTPVDNPFLTPDGNQSSSFNMNSGNEPSPSFTGDQIGTWEISITSLMGYLNGNSLVFLFDNNQQGSGPAQSLDIWGQVNILDANGVSHGCFEFSTGSNCGGTNPAPSTYVPAIGNYCVSTVDGSAYNVGTAQTAGDCSQNPGDYFVNDNLGTNAAEYAVFDQTIDAGLQGWANSGYFLSVNMKYTNNNAGAEQLWICSDCTIGTPTTNVPEPGTTALWGAALMALVACLGIRRAKVKR